MGAARLIEHVAVMHLGAPDTDHLPAVDTHDQVHIAAALGLRAPA
jgi:hypothetical protein